MIKFMALSMLSILFTFIPKFAFGEGEGGGGGEGGGQGGQGGEGGGEGGGQGGQGGGQPANVDIALLEPYKEHSLVKKLRGSGEHITVETLLKDSIAKEELIGKKSAPFDYENSTENEIKDHITSTTPENVDAYNWGDEGAVEADDKEFFGEMLRDMGIPAYKGNKMIEKYLGKQKEVKDAMFSKDGFTKELQKQFGEGETYKKTAGEVTNTIKGNLNAEDAKALDSMPNQYLGLIYKLTHNMMKQYGVVEGEDRGAGGGAGAGAGNVDEIRSAIRKEIAALTSKPHTAEQKKTLSDKLTATYKNDSRLKK